MRKISPEKVRNAGSVFGHVSTTPVDIRDSPGHGATLESQVHIAMAIF
jgi:hypothetical protein